MCILLRARRQDSHFPRAFGREASALRRTDCALVTFESESAAHGTTSHRATVCDSV